MAYASSDRCFNVLLLFFIMVALQRHEFLTILLRDSILITQVSDESPVNHAIVKALSELCWLDHCVQVTSARQDRVFYMSYVEH
ncbi:hypothetical protein EDB19DRAFT_1674080 [Suillus lakei]|nr:hypothetical protein EDB19DRAFT_1674080 [Suillus lakei]